MKNVLITGANRGIGLETVKKFLNEGYYVFFGSRSIEKGLKVVESLDKKENVTLVELDVSKDDSVTNAVSFILEQTDHIDILVNNAGINYDTWNNAITADFNELRATINTNLMGAWRMLQAIVPIMEKNNYGRIINVSSMAGQFKSLGASTPGYSVSKAAMNALTVNVANYLKGDIKINSISPGWVRTDMGGMNATRSPIDAAKDIYELSQNNSFNGQFLRYGKPIEF